MKKVLIIGYGDIGRRVAASLPDQKFIGVSRSAPSNLDNVIFIQQDWINQSSLTMPSSDFSTIVLILKPTSSDVDGYKQGFLDASHKIMDFFNNYISYERLLIVTSTRVYGIDNGRNITEVSEPLPDDQQGRVILDYENFISNESKVAPLILRPSGLYDEKALDANHVILLKEKKYVLRFNEANMFSRNNLALVIANYICCKELAHISGPLICSEKALKYSEIFFFPFLS